MYDFVVVGLGPAGSRFARRAAEGGYDVLGFERGEIGSPLACSGHVSRDIWAYTGDDAREALLQHEIYGARFHTGGPTASQRRSQHTERPDGGSVGTAGAVDSDVGTTGAQSHSSVRNSDEDARSSVRNPEDAGSPVRTPDEDARTAGRDRDSSHTFYKSEPVSNVIDRVGLDRHLADLARNAGADLREHHTVTAVDEREDRVVVTVSGPDGIDEYEARMVAGCDGPRSKVRSELGLDEPDEILHGVLGFDERPDFAEYVDVHLTPPRFFAWRIPRGDAGVEFGLATPPGDDVSQRFESFCDAYGVTIDRRCSGAIPIGPPDSVTTRRGFLIGDAAAQTKPFTGGGILYSMGSADHAARTIEPDWPPTLSAYEHAWRSDLEREIRLGHAIRRAYSLPEPVQNAGLKAFSGEIGVHMDRPTSLFSKESLETFLP